jgi:hypothetical protein
MSHPPSAPEARFAAIVEALVGNPGVTRSSDEPQAKKGFGASGQLKVNDKIFAMLVRGKLVVKLPKPRVDALIAAGAGERFDPRHDGRLMKEWLVVAPTFGEEWLPLAREAMEFVAPKH